jgi:hypothetical protein
MDPKSLLKDPTLIGQVPEVDLELVVREVMELSVARSKAATGKKKKHKVATRLMACIGAVFNRSPLFACTLVQAYAEAGGNVNALIKAALSMKNAPCVRGFLDYLRQNLNGNCGPFPPGKPLIVRPSMERACLWNGLDAKQTRQMVAHIKR